MSDNPIEVQKFLGGIGYPATRDALIAHAQESGADGNVLTALENIPDKEYESPTAVSSAISDS
ncbi:MAG: hypothetical protein QOH40_418 [Arthrobacter pascens]|jgi:hypothetical protein|nr:hypothetical protein [Arthrobacter pascens]